METPASYPHYGLAVCRWGYVVGGVTESHNWIGGSEGLVPDPAWPHLLSLHHLVLLRGARLDLGGGHGASYTVVLYDRREPLVVWTRVRLGDHQAFKPLDVVPGGPPHQPSTRSCDTCDLYAGERAVAPGVTPAHLWAGFFVSEGLLPLGVRAPWDPALQTDVEAHLARYNRLTRAQGLPPGRGPTSRP